MVSDFLIPFRETLEAALILGIILAYLHKTKSTHLNAQVYFGAGFGILASILTAIAFQNVAGGFSGTSEELFEGTTMVLAAGILTYVIFWMASQTRYAQAIENKVEKHRQAAQGIGIGLMAFLAVYREGVETVLYLGATIFSHPGSFSLPLAIAGIVTALILGYLVFKTALRFRLKTIMNITSVLLILFAAGLMAHGVHEFQEAGWLPTPYGKVWNTNGILDETSLLGTFAKALFGYNGDPFELEAFAYFAYIAIVALAYRTWIRPRHTASRIR